MSEKQVVATLKKIIRSEQKYDPTPDFICGILRGWLAVKLINRKFYNELVNNFVSTDFEGDDELLMKKYNRVLRSKPALIV
tara:strand:+ start:142 stop:384 length:243 start_codon:yes stop_codon:yes gene_type:complete